MRQNRTFTSLDQEKTYKPIGVFDSGFGGLTVLKEIVKENPQYDYLYLGDNARAPYGSRSFETVYEYTLECVRHLFDRGCHLIILACNTASAKALRTIQQKDLPLLAPNKRVLGVIRPTTELIGKYSRSGHVGVLGTTGTVASESYPVEIAHFFPELKVYQQACPMWVPLIENNEYQNEGARFFIEKYIDTLFSQEKNIDAVILGCTHYPLLINEIKKYIKPGVEVLSQGPIVAAGVKKYLERHPEIRENCSRGGEVKFWTTDLPETFNKAASLFYGQEVRSQHLDLTP